MHKKQWKLETNDAWRPRKCIWRSTWSCKLKPQTWKQLNYGLSLIETSNKELIMLFPTANPVRTKFKIFKMSGWSLEMKLGRSCRGVKIGSNPQLLNTCQIHLRVWVSLSYSFSRRCMTRLRTLSMKPRGMLWIAVNDSIQTFQRTSGISKKKFKK